MKLLLSLIMFFTPFLAQAIPVVNENVASSGTITIYPDYLDPNHFYIAPNVVLLARNQNDVPVFTYLEYKKYVFEKGAYLVMTFVPAYTRADLEDAKLKIIKEKPKAFFSGVPFVESNLSLTGALKQLFEETQCDHKAGLIGQEQSCMMDLTKFGRKTFLKAIEKKALFTTLQFEYSIDAVVRTSDGSFVPRTITHGVAARIDGAQLAEYPDLIIKK